jgi:Asp-tRNA(Asn)/Glu-tRNA(Gln) amidotransferase A subunit family amidase
MSIYSLPLAATVAAVRQGTIPLKGFIDEVCDRIETQEPQLQALLPEPGRRLRLLQEAEVLERTYNRPEQRPLLYGVLLGVKDIIQVDGFVTRAGTHLPANLFRGPEAGIVTRLRKAGVLILGKTITTEFAHLTPAATTNPWNPAHTPGGSSSGSAAAVAAGFCQLAVGTQTIGSVIRPAAFCGLCGFKPSFGRVALDGVIPCSESLDQIGFFTQDASGMAWAAAAALPDWRSANGLPGPVLKPVLGVPDGPYLEQADSEALAAFEKQLSTLEAVGCQVVRARLFAEIEEINGRHKDLVAFEMAQVHAAWYSRYAHLYQPLTREVIEKGKSIKPERATEARLGRFSLRERAEQIRQAQGIDFWVTPAATGPAPRGLESTGNPIMNLPWTYMGLPVLSIPAGHAANGLPLGLQCAAGFQQDELLLHWGLKLEAVFGFAESGLLRT